MDQSPPDQTPLDQTAAPYFEALVRYAAVPRAAFHTPGHIQGHGAHQALRDVVGDRMLSLDISPGLGNLDGVPGSALDQAQDLAAEAYGADRTWFLANGSTLGNQIMVTAVCHPGDVILTSRNTHRSIISALMIAGVRPLYIPAELDPESHIAHGVTPGQVEAALATHPEVRAVMVVSPTYYGVCSDVAGIAEASHRHGVPLLVDEAWGPHFPFHPALPAHALSLGADMVVTGAHKLLSAFLQASMLHVRGDLVDHDRVEVVNRMLQSTSPSCLLRMSLDVARMQMATEGEALLTTAIALATDARSRIEEHPLLSCLDKGLIGSHGVVDFDPTRLSVNVISTGYTGYDVEKMLFDDHAVTVEMADYANVLCNVTMGHTRADLDQLVDALHAIASAPSEHGLDSQGFVERALYEVPEQVMSPGEAFHARQQRVPLADAVGRVSAEMAATYPPGIPVVVPGERLTPALVAHLQAQVAAGGRIVGPQDPRLERIQVVCE
ncbi:MAG: aminotransferase class V-fold PLP-dependent enzyme [Actinomycetota bacterium]|nr:aminotransferase class V-fold PLP-dependent enzyme [Actinomycetota bacterium]